MSFVFSYNSDRLPSNITGLRYKSFQSPKIPNIWPWLLNCLPQIEAIGCKSCIFVKYWHLQNVLFLTFIKIIFIWFKKFIDLKFYLEKYKLFKLSYFKSIWCWRDDADVSKIVYETKQFKFMQTKSNTKTLITLRVYLR